MRAAPSHAALCRFFFGLSVLPRLSKMTKETFPLNTTVPAGNRTAVRVLARGAIIAALYTVLTLLLAPLSYGEVQIRFSEAMTLLPILMPEAVPALAIGCLLSNILGGCTIFDIVFGTLATLLAALCTRRLRERFWLAAVMPVLFNGVIVGAVIHYCYAPVLALPLCMLFVAAGEAVACLIVGPLLIRAMRRIPVKYLT